MRNVHSGWLLDDMKVVAGRDGDTETAGPKLDCCCAKAPAEVVQFLPPVITSRFEVHVRTLLPTAADRQKSSPLEPARNFPFHPTSHDARFVRLISR